MKVGDLVRYMPTPDLVGILLELDRGVFVEQVMDSHGNSAEFYYEEAALILWRGQTPPLWGDARGLEVVGGGRNTLTN